jgi:hypothetical protein
MHVGVTDASGLDAHEDIPITYSRGGQLLSSQWFANLDETDSLHGIPFPQ